MTTANDLAREFLAQKRLAVVGVSGTRDLPANHIYTLLRERGHEVYAVSPSLETFAGDPCYPNLASLPATPDGVVLVTRPEVTLEVVRQCIAAGVGRVWMHDMRGTLPKFAKEFLGAEATGYGWLMGASGVGALCGAVYLASRRTVVGLERIIPVASFAFSLGLISLSFSRSFALSWVLMVFTGGSMMVQMAKKIPADRRARLYQAADGLLNELTLV